MEFRIFVNLHNGCFNLEASGSYCTERALEMIKQTVRHEKWAKGMNVLVDLRKVSFEAVTLVDVNQVADAVTVLEKDYGANRCALVVPYHAYTKAAFYKFTIDLTVNLITRIFGPSGYGKAEQWIAGCGGRRPAAFSPDRSL